ncbi:Zinicin-like metallopeptidase [Arthrobacter alpinus]|uniref:Zinicin-like metallopeptidase n=1 Tax=Arthrobacter alpinus TaxID=656366 RepID=A0A1H5KMA6_9MICC|nr:metallopeptidase family protein [Arthrobacter alpinus]SEE65999.1 Zinicin-like metallopeptidase [Arthrobacter alpinus]
MKFNASHGEEHLTISLEAQDFDGVPTADSPATPRSFARRRRDRHGRGLRGPLLPPALPGARTRSEKFEDLVVDSADRMRTLWPQAMADVEYLVEEVPDKLEALIASGVQAPLGKYEHAVGATAETPAQPPSISIYRHPIEALCDTPAQVRELVHEVMVDQVAGLLNIDPDTVDPLFRRFGGH